MDLTKLSKRETINYIKQLDIRKAVMLFASEYHRNMKGEKMRWDTFRHMLELYLDGPLSKEIVVVGASQIGKTDWLIIYILACAYCGLNVFYVLPHNKMRDNYVQEKILRPISLSSEYQVVLKEAVSKKIEQIQFGKGMIRFVGANVPADMTSFSADVIVIDETDQISSPANIELGLSRISGSEYGYKRFVSNPRGPKDFISARYELSDKRVYKCPCDVCGKYQDLDWFKSVVKEVKNEDGIVVDRYLRDDTWYPGCGKDILLKCTEEGCEGNLDRFSKEAIWEATAVSEYGITGYHMPTLISPLKTVSELWVQYKLALESPSKMEAFYAMVLARPFTESGHKITGNVLEDCTPKEDEDIELIFHIEEDCAYEFYSIKDIKRNGLIPESVMGIDVSPNHIDVSISYGTYNKQYLCFVGRVSPDQVYLLHDLIERYNVKVAVIDIGPEGLLAKEFQLNANCDVWRCKYQGSGDNRELKYNYNDMIVSVDRTEALDASYKKLRMRRLVLPTNYSQILKGNFASEMQALTRVVSEKTDGTVKWIWDGSDNDHFRHADSYRSLADDIFNRDMLYGDDCISIG